MIPNDAHGAPEPPTPAAPGEWPDRLIPPGLVDSPAWGTEAARALGARWISAIADFYDIDPDVLELMLVNDPTLRVDQSGFLSYEDSFSATEDSQYELSTDSAGGSSTGDSYPAPGPDLPDSDTFLLHSLPGSKHTIFLDFDGHVATGGQKNINTGVDPITAAPWDIDGSPGSFGPSEREDIREIWQRVAEDFAPFDVDVTTETPDSSALTRESTGDLTYGMRVVFTGNDLSGVLCSNPPCGGNAFLDVFDRVSPTPLDRLQPAWVIPAHLGPNSPRSMAEAASHEVGHTLSLSHDGTVTASGVGCGGYYVGHGTWGPIMGAAYGKLPSQWSKGEYTDANCNQDDLAAITSSGAPYRVDDYPDTNGAGAPIASGAALGGVISTTADVDAFTFTGSGPIQVDLSPWPVGPNLDAKIQLVASDGTVLKEHDPDAVAAPSMTATFVEAPPDTYTVLIDGVGYLSPLDTGWSDYGSLGFYEIRSDYNRLPTAVAASTPGAGGNPFAVQFSSAGSTDPDGTIQSYLWDFGDGNTSTVANPTWTYAVAGTYTVSLTVTDNVGATHTTQITVVVAVQATANDDNASTDEDTATSISVLANDNPSADLEILGVTQPPKGTVAVNSAGPGLDAVTFDPGADFQHLAAGQTEVVTFTYQVEDSNDPVSQGGSASTATVTVTVVGRNDAPVAVDDTASTTEDAAVVVPPLLTTGLDSDIDDGDVIVLSGFTPPTQGTVTQTGSTLTYDPGTAFQYLKAGETATVTIPYSISDGSGATASAVIEVTIVGANDAPIANDDAATTDEDSVLVLSPIVGPGADSDIDGDPLTITSFTPPGSGTVTLVGNTLTFDPGADFQYLGDGESTAIAIPYSISDGQGGVDTAVITITVTGVNDAPTAVDDAYAVSAGASIVFDPTAASGLDSDPEMDSLSVVGVAPPLNGTVSQVGSTLTFDTGTQFGYLGVGETSDVEFVYTVADPGGRTSTATIIVTVTGVNDSPAALDDNYVVSEDAVLFADPVKGLQTGTVVDTDVDLNDVLSVFQSSSPTDGTLVWNGNTFTYESDPAWQALDEGESHVVTFDYSIQDTSGANDTATVTITVVGVNDAPIVEDDTAVVDENGSVVIEPLLATGADHDPEGHSLTVTAAGPSSVGAVTLNGNSVSFTPGTDFDGLAQGETATVQIPYTIADSRGLTDSGTITVTINGVNNAPQGQDHTTTIPEDGSTLIPVRSAAAVVDPDGTSFVLSVVSAPGQGTLTVQGEDLIFEPGEALQSLKAGEELLVPVTYRIADEFGATVDVEMVLRVTGANDAPSAVDDSVSAVGGTTVDIPVLANDSDIDGDEIVLAQNGSVLRAGPSTAGATLSIGPGGTIRYVAPVSFSGVDSFTYWIEDANGAEASATVTVNVAQGSTGGENEQSTTGGNSGGTTGSPTQGATTGSGAANTTGGSATGGSTTGAQGASSVNGTPGAEALAGSLGGSSGRAGAGQAWQAQQRSAPGPASVTPQAQPLLAESVQTGPASAGERSVNTSTQPGSHATVQGAVLTRGQSRSVAFTGSTVLPMLLLGLGVFLAGGSLLGFASTSDERPGRRRRLS